jgi:hypothetical protein
VPVELASLGVGIPTGAVSALARNHRGVLSERRATSSVIPPLTQKEETMAKAGAKGKGRPAKKVPFGGYAVNFKGCSDTLESVFGSAPMPPSGMTKRLWEYVKRRRLATKG